MSGHPRDAKKVLVTGTGRLRKFKENSMIFHFNVVKPRLTATSVKYGLLVITATLFWPRGKKAIHFLLKKSVNTVIL